MGIEHPFFAYRSFNKELATVKRFYDIGVRQFCVFPANTTNSLGQNYSEYPINWCYLNAYEFEHVDQQMNDILEQAPEGKFLFMIDLNTPYWLVRTLQNTLCDSMLGLTDALTTDRWRKEVLKYMKELINHVETTFPGKVEAYILACGQTDEWMDYSKGRELAGKLECFRKWCKNNHMDIPEAIPTISQRFRSDPPWDLRSPDKDQLSLHFWRFISDCVADGIVFFAKEARKLIPPTTKLGCFFGYILELTSGRLVQSGHLAYEKVFSRPELDFFISPGDYSDRDMGGAAGYMSPNGTIHLKGKNYFHEIDHRTHSANMQITKHVALPWMHAWPDVKADIAGLRREFCLSLFHGASLWWFDMWGKFYEDQALIDEIAHFKTLHDTLSCPTREPEAEVAVIVDPDSTYYINDEVSELTGLYRSTMNSLNRLGAPFKTYSFNDIPHIKDLDRLKMVIFPGLFEVTPKKKAMLEKYILNNNRLIIWLYSTAIFDGNHRDVSQMEKLTGVPWRRIRFQSLDRDGWTSCFVPHQDGLTPKVLRFLAKAAEVHLFVDECCPVWYGDNLLMVHTNVSGRKRILLKQPAEPTVLLGRDIAASDGMSFDYDFDAPETILVQLKPTTK